MMRMIENLSDETINIFQALFEMSDTDNDGEISVRQLRSIMCSIGKNPSEEKLTKMTQDVDLDGSGTINFKEFLYLMAKIMNDDETEELLIEAFKVFDKDGNGFITSHELRNIMIHLEEDLTPVEIEEMVREADINNDGTIDLEEFVKMMSSE